MGRPDAPFKRSEQSLLRQEHCPNYVLTAAAEAGGASFSS
jgi:hypothetical protein